MAAEFNEGITDTLLQMPAGFHKKGELKRKKKVVFLILYLFWNDY